LAKHRISQVCQPPPTHPTPPAGKFGSLQLLALPKPKITVEREGISYYGRDGKREQEADGSAEKGLRILFLKV
jgi:hypothetical protein